MPTDTSHLPTLHCLVGVDGSSLSLKAFRVACDLIRPHQATLSLVAVVHNPMIVMAEATERERLIAQEKRRLAEVLAPLLAEAEPWADRLQHDILIGEPSQILLQYAQTHDVDHIVLGHRSTRSITQWLLGSVAKAVVDGAECTVTVVR